MRQPIHVVRFLFGCLLLTASATQAARPAMILARNNWSGNHLLLNGDFEASEGDRPWAWISQGDGFQPAPGEGREGSRCVRCESGTDRGDFGARQSLMLGRARPVPVVVRGWSRAQDVSGAADSGYSLYVDIVYADGTPLWGQTADFRTGTHDWEQREFVIYPAKPIKSLTLNLLFRGHTGRVWFDDCSVAELPSGSGTVLFEGLPLREPAKRREPAGKTSRFRTRDGLELALCDGAVTSLRVDEHQVASSAPSGFLARDALADSDFYGFTGGECHELGLNLTQHFEAEPDRLVISGRVSDTTGRDRAVTLLFALPIDAAGWRWGDDIGQSRVIEGAGEFLRGQRVGCGATGTMSVYPLAALYNAQVGLGLAIDMGQPAVYRLVYHAGTRQFFIAYDFGLVPQPKRFPSSADFRFVIYRFSPRWGFRAAFRKLMDIFPQYFLVRSHEQGLWMPFTDISTVQGWEDFGFRYHEGDNNVAWDHTHGILSFRYTEPMTWWMRMSEGAPRTIDSALEQRDRLALGSGNQQRKMAQVCQLAAMDDESGQPALLFRNEPWCRGAVWSLNPNPFLETAGADRAPTGYNAATVYWNDSVKESLYGPEVTDRRGGEYLDSLEGYVTAELNFRRDHFAATTVPLTFSFDSKRPGLFKGLAAFELTRWLSEDVHRLNKLMFANSVPYRFCFLCPWLDVLGTETDWLAGGKYRPAAESQMNLWRTMSGAKPYLLLMNTDFDEFDSSLVERYFNRCLSYGLFPGMFSHNAADHPYWQNPKWYNRDRPLFKKYLPLIKRVAEAGWQPITLATCDNARVRVERFGPGADAIVYFTVFNDSPASLDSVVKVDFDALGRSGPPAVRESLSGEKFAAGVASFPLSIPAQKTRVIEVAPARAHTP